MEPICLSAFYILVSDFNSLNLGFQYSLVLQSGLKAQVCVFLSLNLMYMQNVILRPITCVPTFLHWSGATFKSLCLPFCSYCLYNNTTSPLSPVVWFHIKKS